MSTIVENKPYTPKDLLAMPDSVQYELVNGELVERNVSVLSSFVEGTVYKKLAAYNDAYNLGWVWPGTLGYLCFPDAPTKVRKPDFSFVRKERFSPDHLSEGFLSIAPDLAVEVISPGDLASEIDEKVEEYLAAGVLLVWVINPETRIVAVHRQDGSVTKLHENDELTGETVLPDFRCRVAELFPPPGVANVCS